MDNGLTTATVSQLPGTPRLCMRPNVYQPDKKESAMPIRIENRTCFFKVNDEGREYSLPAAEVTVSTDVPSAMSYVDVGAERVYITEQEADALTVAGAIDGRQHKKVTTPDSAI